MLQSRERACSSQILCSHAPVLDTVVLHLLERLPDIASLRSTAGCSSRELEHLEAVLLAADLAAAQEAPVEYRRLPGRRL